MKRALIALLAGTAVFGSVFAFAAALGVSSDNLGAGSDVVAACTEDDIDASYDTAWGTGEFVVTDVALDGPDDCAGQTVDVQVRGANDLSENLGQQTLDANGDFTYDDLVISAKDVETIDVVVTG